MLKYITFPSLIELKLAAGRLRDEADIVELLQQNQQHIEDVRRHLLTVHTQYVARFDALLDRLDELVDDA